MLSQSNRRKPTDTTTPNSRFNYNLININYFHELFSSFDFENALIFSWVKNRPIVFYVMVINRLKEKFGHLECNRRTHLLTKGRNRNLEKKVELNY